MSGEKDCAIIKYDVDYFEICAIFVGHQTDKDTLEWLDPSCNM